MGMEGPPGGGARPERITTTNALLAFIWPCDRDFDVSWRQSLWLSPHSQRPVRIWWMLAAAAAAAAASQGRQSMDC